MLCADGFFQGILFIFLRLRLYLLFVFLVLLPYLSAFSSVVFFSFLRRLLFNHDPSLLNY